MRLSEVALLGNRTGTHTGMSKRFPKKDPFHQRESEKYENPIPSREFIMELLEHEGRPLNREQITALLKLEDEVSIEALRRRLRAMERDGQLIYNRRGDYGLVRKMDLVRGRVVGHPDGFGFLVPDEGGGDLFLAAREMRGAMHGDRVVARVSGLDRRGRREGVIVEILERAQTRVVGRLLVEHGISLVVPEDRRISHDLLIPAEGLAG